MKAIETRYKGYRFRSRLEARWAVYFDACGFPWTYESEGVVLPSGRHYLPDFLLADQLWVEIKPDPRGYVRKADLSMEHPLVAAVGAVEELARASGKDTLIVGGDPVEYTSGWFLADTDEFASGARFSLCRNCDGLALMSDAHGQARAYCGCDRALRRWPVETDPAFAAAARAARFEHGETPR